MRNTFYSASFRREGERGSEREREGERGVEEVREIGRKIEGESRGEWEGEGV